MTTSLRYTFLVGLLALGCACDSLPVPVGEVPAGANGKGGAGAAGGGNDGGNGGGAPAAGAAGAGAGAGGGGAGGGGAGGGGAGGGEGGALAAACLACARPPAQASDEYVCRSSPAPLGCPAGRADCDGDPGDGCETPTDTVLNCGGCGVTCGDGEVCSPEGCAPSCAPPDTLCGGAARACVSLATSPEHCGGCDRRCQPPPGGVAACENGTCTFECASGREACGGGCVDTSSDPDHCGACGARCPSPIGALRACAAGACQVACGPGAEICPCSPGDPLCASRCVDVRSDAENCGGCGVRCDGACVDGACRPAGGDVVVDLTGTPWRPARPQADATHLYWISGADVVRAPKAGGPAEAVATGQAGPAGLAARDGFVYWTNRLGGAVLRAPAAGGAPQIVAAASEPGVLAVDGAHAYWFDGGTDAVRRAPVGGGASEEVVPVPDAIHLAVDERNVYVLDAISLRALFRAPKAGGAPVRLRTADESTFALTAEAVVLGECSLLGDCGLIYLSKDDGHEVGSFRVGSYYALLAGVGSTCGLAADEAGAFANFGGATFRVDGCGAAPAAYRPVEPSGCDFALDADALYVADGLTFRRARR